eukprot:3992191-Amphidinium_carterae.1
MPCAAMLTQEQLSLLSNTGRRMDCHDSPQASRRMQIAGLSNLAAHAAYHVMEVNAYKLSHEMNKLRFQQLRAHVRVRKKNHK